MVVGEDTDHELGKYSGRWTPATVLGENRMAAGDTDHYIGEKYNGRRGHDHLFPAVVGVLTNHHRELSMERYVQQRHGLKDSMSPM